MLGLAHHACPSCVVRCAGERPSRCGRRVGDVDFKPVRRFRQTCPDTHVGPVCFDPRRDAAMGNQFKGEQTQRIVSSFSGWLAAKHGRSQSPLLVPPTPTLTLHPPEVELALGRLTSRAREKHNPRPTCRAPPIQHTNDSRCIIGLSRILPKPVCPVWTRLFARSVLASDLDVYRARSRQSGCTPCERPVATVRRRRLHVCSFPVGHGIANAAPMGLVSCIVVCFFSG